MQEERRKGEYGEKEMRSERGRMEAGGCSVGVCEAAR